MSVVPPATTPAAGVEAEAVAFEQAAVIAVTAGLAAQVAAAVAAIYASWETLQAGVGAATLPVSAARQLTTVVRRALEAVNVDLRPALERQARAGFELGQAHARTLGPVDRLDDLDQVVPDLGDDEPPAPEPPRIRPLPDIETPAGREAAETTGDTNDRDRDGGEPGITLDELDDRDPDLVETVVTVDVRARDRRDATIELAETLPMSSEGDVDQVARTAEGVVHGARRDTVWAVDRAMAAGQAAVAKEVGGGLLWVAERDACLICLGFAGQVAYNGRPFPGDQYGDHPLPVVPYPPAHPHCRCRARPYTGPPPERDISADDPASVLAREARRSVARGWSAYDSRPARLRAVQRLIDEGADLPRSVVARARRNLAAGEFERDGGRFPDQGPGQRGALPPPPRRPVRPGADP